MEEKYFKKLQNPYSDKYLLENIYEKIFVQAVEKGDLITVNFLINKYVDVNYNDTKALGYGVNGKHYKIVKLLLLNGANGNVANNYLIFICIINNDPKMLNIFLTYCNFDDIYEKLLDRLYYEPDLDNDEKNSMLIILFNHYRKFLKFGKHYSADELQEIKKKFPYKKIEIIID